MTEPIKGVMKECPVCKHENSDKAIYKCIECGTLFITQEEADALFPPGRGGDWGWGRNDEELMEKYALDVRNGTWKMDPELRGVNGWIDPEGNWWPCGWQQHKYSAPALVAFFDLYGAPRVRLHEGRGGMVTSDKLGNEYYELTPRYPDSQDILLESHWLKVTPGLESETLMFYTGYHNENVTDAQHRTIAKWRVVNDIETIDQYDQQERWRKEDERGSSTM